MHDLGAYKYLEKQRVSISPKNYSLPNNIKMGSNKCTVYLVIGYAESIYRKSFNGEVHPDINSVLI